MITQVFYLPLALLLLATTNSFPLSVQKRPTRSTTALSAASAVLPPNEFSRTVQPERILQTRRDYHMDLEANSNECEALAQRFDLSAISKLTASISLRPERAGGARSSGMEVEGTILASVTQKCVRTNEDFAVDLEFPLYCIVRPVAPLSARLQGGSQESSAAVKRKDVASSKTVSDLDVTELQRLLQQDIDDDEDVLMEDDAIYPLDGRLDVGELVAQLFWLQLDPYPKRPGSSPIQRSITG